MIDQPKPRKQDAATPTTEELQGWQGEPKPTAESSDQLANQRGPIGMKDGKPYPLAMPVMCDVQPVQSLTTTGEQEWPNAPVMTEVQQQIIKELAAKIVYHVNTSVRERLIAVAINAALAAEREKHERTLAILDKATEQLRDQLADVTSAAQMAVGAEKRKLAAALAALKQIRDKTDNRASSRAIAHVALEGDTTALDAAIAEAVKKAEVLWRKGWHECDICRTQWFISVDGIIGCPVCQDKRVAAAVAEVEEHNIRGAIHPDVLAKHISAAQKPLVELLRSVHTWFMQKCPGEYNGCGLWIDVDDVLSEHPRRNCILDVDNHCHPNRKEEYQQCGCADCRAALAKVKEGRP